MMSDPRADFLHFLPRCPYPPVTRRALTSYLKLANTHAEMAMLFPATLVVADLLALAGAPPAHGPLDAVRDFGALPDGACPSETMSCTGTDNTPMLQAAIDAAQRQGRPLWLPEGRYMVNSTLTVGCATPATSCPGCTPTGDAGACVEPNATAGAWGLYPLVLTGAGRSLTTIATVHNLHAIMAFNGPPQGGTVGKSTILHDLRDLGFDSGGGNSCPKCPCRYSATCGQANFSIIARSITRSDFTRLSFFNSRIAGMSLACAFSACDRTASYSLCSLAWRPATDTVCMPFVLQTAGSTASETLCFQTITSDYISGTSVTMSTSLAQISTAIRSQ